MLPVLPQTPAPDVNRAPGNDTAAVKSSRWGASSDQSKSFSATLNQISDRNRRGSLESTAADKPAVTSRRSNTGPQHPGKMSKTNAPKRDGIAENEAPGSGEKNPSVRPWQGFGLIPYYLMNVSMTVDGSLAVEPPSDSTTGPRLRMLSDLIGYLQSHGKNVQNGRVGIGPFEQLQTHISPEAINRFLSAWAIQHQDSGDLMGTSALEGTLNGQSDLSGVKTNASFNPMLHLLGVTGAAWGLNPDTSSSGGLRMAAGTQGVYLNADHLLKMVSPFQPSETGISENTKMAAAGHDGRLPFWASGDSNTETLLEAQSRHLSENFQAFKNRAALKAAAEQSANPNSTTEGVSAKTPEEIFGLKSAVPKSEILPVDAFGNKISRIDGDSKDSGFSFSQDQMPQHLARLENAAQSPEGGQRSLMSQTLNQIVQKAVLSLANGQHEVQIDLKPEFLGHIRMQIVTESQQVAVRIVAELPFVKDMLESNLNQLKTELQAQGLEVDELEVSVAHDSRADDDKHQKAAEMLRERASKNSRFPADADAAEQTDMRIGRDDGMAETAIDYFA
jgi:hypothetical protein